jgi:nucleotide-binding universal stress UspA family protein
VRGFHHVLVALGGTPVARDAELVREAADLVDEDGELTLLCVAAIAVPAEPSALLPDLRYDGQALLEEQSFIDTFARERLDAAARHVPRSVVHHEELRWGELAEAALEELHDGAYDLVVVGHHPRSEVSIILHGGSMAHRLLHHSPVPVLVHPWREGAERHPETAALQHS